MILSSPPRCRDMHTHCVNKRRTPLPPHPPESLAHKRDVRFQCLGWRLVRRSASTQTRSSLLLVGVTVMEGELACICSILAVVNPMAASQRYYFAHQVARLEQSGSDTCFVFH